MAKGREAFARAKAMFAMIFAAASLPTLGERKLALAGISPYRSRGHGLGCISNKNSRRCVAHDKRAARKARNRSRA